MVNWISKLWPLHRLIWLFSSNTNSWQNYQYTMTDRLQEQSPFLKKSNSVKVCKSIISFQIALLVKKKNLNWFWDIVLVNLQIVMMLYSNFSCLKKKKKNHSNSVTFFAQCNLQINTPNKQLICCMFSVIKYNIWRKSQCMLNLPQQCWQSSFLPHCLDATCSKILS